ncbi:hypothetical protein ACXHXG_12030 [Rhizobium sp. LEGMi198b]
MQKPAQFRAIFAELRSGLGPDIPAKQLAQIAILIMRAYRDASEDVDGWGVSTESRAFQTLPVDEAMKDGGWRVLEFEIRRYSKIDDIGLNATLALRAAIEKYLGPAWRHHQLPPDRL